MTINNDFAYPNANSYRSFGRENFFNSATGQGAVSTGLAHGMIYSMNVTNNGPGNPGVRSASQVLAKKFQFNPAALQFTLSMVETDPAISETTGGNNPAGTGVGAATTALSLAFNREIEVFRATAGNANTPEYFKDLGVAKDILDLYRVLLGEGNASVVADQSATLEYLNGELFDMAVAGREITQRPVIVSFNRALTYYGKVMGMVYEFQKFNHRMVPTIATVTLNIDITNINSSRAIQSTALGTSSSTAGSTSVPNSGSNTSYAPPNSGYTGNIPSGYIVAGGIRWGP